MKINILLLALFGLLLTSKSFAQQISIESVQSLKIESLYKGRILGTATGFVIKSKSQYYLITNWHVVKNRSSWDNSWLDTIPENQHEADELNVMFTSPKDIGKKVKSVIKLISSKGMFLYKEFSYRGVVVDVVAVPLSDTSSKDVAIYPVTYQNTFSEINIRPSEIITVIGYPLGIHYSDFFPLWKSGFIASEVEIDVSNSPIILVDMLGFGGMSGSPVYYITHNIQYKNFMGEGSADISHTSKQTFFMGVFSHGWPDSHLSALWKSTYLKTLFDSLE